MHEHNSDTTGVHRLTKNNYFYGKLLTVGDMATEQAYHSGVQRMLSRFVTNWGGICGLDVDWKTVTADETGQESLVVDVSEGLALDRCGRLIVVSDDQSRRVTLPPTAGGSETDTIAIFVEYAECYTDPVPAAKMENACEEECKDNRIVEDAEIRVEPGDPGDSHKSIAAVDFPTAADLGEPADTDEATDLDAVLAGLARSYYESESRESCGGLDEGPVLVGTLTAADGQWEAATFERGPLVYTNDMLYDILARHVADFDNPHEVSLGVGPADDERAAQVGVEEASGVTGSVGLTSTDDSIAITPAPSEGTVDLAARGLGDDFEAYYVYEQALHTTVVAFTELIENARDVWVPDLVPHLSFRIARTAMHGLEEAVYTSPEQFLEFLSAPHQEFYPEEQLPFDRVSAVAAGVLGEDSFDVAAEFDIADELDMSGDFAVPDEIDVPDELVLPSVTSIVDLERLLRRLLVPNDRADPAVPVRNYAQALETLHSRLDSSDGEPAAFDVAMAQDRVAEAAQGVLDSYPAVVDGVPPDYWAWFEQYIHNVGNQSEEGYVSHLGSHTTSAIPSPEEGQAPLGLQHRPVAQPRLGRGLVPEINQPGTLSHVLHQLRMTGWTYLLDPVQADGKATASNTVIDQRPEPQATAHKAPGILLVVNDLVPADEIDGIGPSYRQDLTRFGIDTISEVFLASRSALKLATDAPMKEVVDWRSQAVRMERHLSWTRYANVDTETAKAISELERQRAASDGEEFASPADTEMTADEISRFVDDVTKAADEHDIADRERTAIRNVNWDEVRTEITK